MVDNADKDDGDTVGDDNGHDDSDNDTHHGDWREDDAVSLIKLSPIISD